LVTTVLKEAGTQYLALQEPTEKMKRVKQGRNFGQLVAILVQKVIFAGLRVWIYTEIKSTTRSQK